MRELTDFAKRFKRLAGVMLTGLEGGGQSVTAAGAGTEAGSVLEPSRGRSCEGCVCLTTGLLALLLSVRLSRLPFDLKLNAISTSVAACIQHTNDV